MLLPTPSPRAGNGPIKGRPNSASPEESTWVRPLLPQASLVLTAGDPHRETHTPQADSWTSALQEAEKPPPGRTQKALET